MSLKGSLCFLNANASLGVLRRPFVSLKRHFVFYRRRFVTLDRSEAKGAHCSTEEGQVLDPHEPTDHVGFFALANDGMGVLCDLSFFVLYKTWPQQAFLLIFFLDEIHLFYCNFSQTTTVTAAENTIRL